MTAANPGSEGSSSRDAAALAAERRRRYQADIASMLDYCRDRGIALPSSIGEGATKAEAAALAREGEPGAGLDEIVRLHGQLSALVEPATPRSLAATELAWSNKRARSTIVLICALILAALVGIGMYIGSLYLVDTVPKASAVEPDGEGAHEEDEPLVVLVDEAEREDPAGSQDAASGDSPAGARESGGGTEPEASAVAEEAPECGTSVLWTQLNYLFAALLGAAFNGLLIAYGYVRKRSFDPSYILSYYIRLAVGVTAGMIVANLGHELFEGESTISRLAPGMVALLGGYSADAVRLILDRLVDVLVTAVTGKDTSAADRDAVARELLDISQSAAADPKTPTDVRDKLDNLLRRLRR